MGGGGSTLRSRVVEGAHCLNVPPQSRGDAGCKLAGASAARERANCNVAPFATTTRGESAPPPPSLAPRLQWTSPRARGEAERNRVLATPARPSFAKAKFTKSHSHEKPRAFRVERREAPGSWATPRGRMLPPAHASGVARATEDPLARTVCFGRAAPPGAPPPSRFSAAAVDRRRLRAAFRSCQPESAAGVLTERIDSLCNGKRDAVSRTKFLWP